MVSSLLVISLFAFVGWLILRARRKLHRAADEARAREAAFVENLGVVQEKVPQSVPVPAPVAPASTFPCSGFTAAGTNDLPEIAYLSAERAQTFRLLKAALPDHEIFPHGSLRRVLGPAAPGKDLQVDFVVCSAEFRPVAVVDLEGPEDLPPVVALKRERLVAAGIAYARWSGQALPTTAGVREALLGVGKQP